MARFCGVVVITSALHAEGHEFEPRQNLVNFQELYQMLTTRPTDSIADPTFKGNLTPETHTMRHQMHQSAHQWKNDRFLLAEFGMEDY